MSRESNMNTIRAIFEADARKDVNGFVDLFDTDCILVLIPTRQTFRGTDQLKRLDTNFFDAYKKDGCIISRRETDAYGIVERERTGL